MLAIVVTLTLASCREHNVIQDGDEIFAILEESVAEVSWSNNGRSVVVRRDSRTGRFSYRFVRDGKKHQCGPDAQRDAAVRRAFQIRAGHVFDGTRTRELLSIPREQWVELEVRGLGGKIEPFRLSLLPAAAGASSEPDALMREFATGFSVDAKLLDMLRFGCEQAASRQARVPAHGVFAYLYVRCVPQRKARFRGEEGTPAVCGTQQSPVAELVLSGLLRVDEAAGLPIPADIGEAPAPSIGFPPPAAVSPHAREDKATA